MKFELLSYAKRKAIMFEEQKGRCLKCKRKMWLGKKINLEYDHKNGYNRDNRRRNSRLLCPIKKWARKYKSI